MKTNPLNKDVSTRNLLVIGTVTRKRVRMRAVELATSDGRAAQEVVKSDWEQAKQELTGNQDACQLI